MLSTNIKKVIARDGEREIVESSWEEMQNFIMDQRRPEFEDDDVLCVRFLICDFDSIEDADSTSWYVNPAYASAMERNLSKFRSEEDIWESKLSSNQPTNSNSLKMSPDFLPEILLITPLPKQDDIFTLYSSFYLSLILTSEIDLSDEEKYARFMNYLEEENTIKKPCGNVTDD